MKRSIELPRASLFLATEHPLGRRVEQDNALAAVGGDDGIHCGLDKALLPLLTFA